MKNKKRKRTESKRILAEVTGLLLLAGISLAITACGAAGGQDELITKADGNASENTSSGEDGTAGGNSGAEDESYVLTEEEMEQDHLLLTLSDKVTIDAYLTPYSYYADGIGIWEPHTTRPAEDSEDQGLDGWSDEDAILGGTVTVGEFVEAMDTLAESLGEPWKSEWEAAKEGSVYTHTYGTTSSLLLGMSTVSLTTKNCWNEFEGYLMGLSSYYPDGEEDLDFLSMEELTETMTEALEKVYPDLAPHCELFSVQEDGVEYYYMRYYLGVEKIPVRRAEVRHYIPAGQMAEDSYGYSERYETEKYSLSCSEGWPIVTVYVTAEGMDIYFEAPDTFTLYEEAKEVVDVNAILPKIVSAFQYTSKTIRVLGIELVMAEIETQEEDGKYRIVYAPYWVANYTEEDSAGETVDRQLVWDAYTGEKVVNY
ncbi:MAG: hypothetical protein LUE29_14040 [Lachnospiraceae bacterium]|nr:hypothetical protein [Lachnospiraceae bacterium]